MENLVQYSLDVFHSISVSYIWTFARNTTIIPRSKAILRFFCGFFK